MGDLSAHFSTSELWCHHCHVLRLDPGLLPALERLRADVKRPVYILSGYRCEVYNRQIGGALHSRHLVGAAVDFSMYQFEPPTIFKAGFIGVGVKAGQHGEPWCVHADLRQGAPFTFLDG